MPVMVVLSVSPSVHGLMLVLVLLVIETFPVYPEDQTPEAVNVTFTPVAAESGVTIRHATTAAQRKDDRFHEDFILMLLILWFDLPLA